MTFWILLVLAGWLSFLSLRHIHILLSLGASMSWLTLMAYNTVYPPTNVVVGSTVHEWMTYVFVVVAIAVMFIWFRNRGHKESVTRVGANEKEVVAHTTTRENVIGGIDEYRARVKKALQPKTRRK